MSIPDNQIYWIWLQGCLGVNSRRLLPALEMFGSAKEIYSASGSDLKLAGIFTPRELEKLDDKRTDRCERALITCEREGINAVHIGEEGYPTRLSRIQTPPVMLYIKGTMPPEDVFHAAIVGTRYPSNLSRSLSYNFAYDLASNGAVIVSGGALGVDTAAHSGAVDCGGTTLCVIGCGLDCYQSSVRELVMERITIDGAVLTEYPPGMPPEKYNFPMRNRIITGLSNACLVVQAGAGSGALIAAKCALSQGRKLFAVPGPLDSERYIGSNLLLKNGVAAALSYRDILRWYKYESQKPIEENRINIDDSFKEEISSKFEGLDGRTHDYSDRAVFAPRGYMMNVLIDEHCRNTDLSDAAISPITYNNINAEAQQPELEMEFPEEEDNIVEILPDQEENKTGPGLISHGGVITEAIAMGDDPELSGLSMEKRISLVLLGRLGMTEDEFLRIAGIERKPKRMTSTEYDDMEFLKRLYDYIGWKWGATEISPEAVWIADREPPGLIRSKSNRRVRRSDENDTQKTAVKNNNEASDKTRQIGENVKIIQNFPSEQLTENARAVYDTFSDTAIHIDSIMLRTGLVMSTVMTALTELQICGLIERLPGGRYARK